MTDHVMIDIETLGNGNEAALLSIGACKFDPNNPRKKIEDSFYVAIDPATCQAYGLKIDATTVMWWMDDQRNEARSRLMADDRTDLATALEGFSMWFGNKSMPVWGNGATFDNVIMRSAYAKIGDEAPWKFWDDRCYRTLKNFATGIKLSRVGTYHNALDDAISQALHLQQIAYSLRIKVS